MLGNRFVDPRFGIPSSCLSPADSHSDEAALYLYIANMLQYMDVSSMAIMQLILHIHLKSEFMPASTNHNLMHTDWLFRFIISSQENYCERNRGYYKNAKHSGCGSGIDRSAPHSTHSQVTEMQTRRSRGSIPGSI